MTKTEWEYHPPNWAQRCFAVIISLALANGIVDLLKLLVNR